MYHADLLMTLTEILELVGTLDDAPGQNTARERFRAHLAKSVTTVGALRDYIETCLRTPGPQYARALQDLVNHCGRLLGFGVEFGRYQGVPSEIGHDGLWKSPSSGDVIIPEVKTTDAYAVQTATLVGYVDRLISDKKIRDWDQALGLYVVGRVDAKLSQMTNAIIAQPIVQATRGGSSRARLQLRPTSVSRSFMHRASPFIISISTSNRRENCLVSSRRTLGLRASKLSRVRLADSTRG